MSWEANLELRCLVQWTFKLRLAGRIRKQDGSLAKAIFDEQVVIWWPGLAKEVEVICKEVGLENVYEKEVRKEEVEEALFYANQKMIKEEMMRNQKTVSKKNTTGFASTF